MSQVDLAPGFMRAAEIEIGSDERRASQCCEDAALLWWFAADRLADGRPNPRSMTTAAVQGPIPRSSTNRAIASVVGSVSKSSAVSCPATSKPAACCRVRALVALKPSERSTAGSVSMIDAGGGNG